MSEKSKKIAALNDEMRQNFANPKYGKFVLTAGVDGYDLAEKLTIAHAVKIYRDFDKDNDPYGEHDFGSFEWGGTKFFWKIDYYDKSMEYGSEDPADPAVTTRVLTVMLAEEY